MVINMTDAKHTPGPWYYVDNIEAGEFFGCGVSETEEGPEFIWFDDARDPERDIANARLIAAAPDLLEALEEVLDALGFLSGGDHELMGLGISEERAKEIRAAIAKAKGGAE